MEFLFPIFMIILGFVILLSGGEFLVKSAVSIAARLKISPAIIGLTIIAAGTSAPELVTSLFASLKNAPDVAIGNIVGSNIFNILAILGFASLIKPNRVDIDFMRIEIPMLIICTILLIGFSWDLKFEQIEGVLSLFVLAVLFYISIYRAKKVEFEAADEIQILKSPWLDAGFLLLGIAALVGGAHLALENGIVLGRLLGLSERIIGITIISIGTGLPELATSVVAAYKGHNDIAIGNVIGSNLVNTMGVAGVATSFKTLEISEELAHFDTLILLAVTIFLFVIIFLSKQIINRAMGLLFIILYIAYIGLVIHK
ncbi:MAG: calcium/sodium antiporter [Bdellovibrionales bacterium]|nr:calcium/sodium antiporter [Bdellovibrionales bacterium]